MDEQGAIQKGQARPWPLHPGSAIGARFCGIQNPQCARSQAAMGHSRAVRWHEQWSAAGRVEVHARGQGVEVTRYLGSCSSGTHRAQSYFSYSDRKNAKCRELVRLLLVAVGSRCRYGCWTADVTERRLFPVVARLKKQFDVHGSRVNSPLYRHGGRVNNPAISTVAVSMRGVSVPSIDTATVHYLDKPSIWPRIKMICRHWGARGPPAHSYRAGQYAAMRAASFFNHLEIRNCHERNTEIER